MEDKTTAELDLALVIPLKGSRFWYGPDTRWEQGPSLSAFSKTFSTFFLNADDSMSVKALE